VSSLIRHDPFNHVIPVNSVVFKLVVLIQIIHVPGLMARPAKHDQIVLVEILGLKRVLNVVNAQL